MAKHLLDRVVVDPDVMHGKPVIEGTRVPVEIVINALASGESTEEVCGEYGLEREDVLAALRYAASHLSGEEYRPIQA